mgnify:FL=1
MKQLILLLIIIAPIFVFSQGKDTSLVCIPEHKAKNLLIQAEKGKISEQQVQSFLNMDSLYMDLSRDFKITFMSQQESIKNLVATNSLGVKVIENGFKDVRADFNNLRDNFALKNMWLEDENRKLERKIDNRNKTIIILSSVIATVTLAAFAF